MTVGLNFWLVSILALSNTAIRGIVLLLVLLVPAGAALYWITQFFRRKNRRAKMQTLARQMGFSFNPKMPIPSSIIDYKFFSEWKSDFPNILNVLYGSINGLDVLIFDYRQAHGSPDSYGKGSTHSSNPHTNPYAETLICIQSGQRPPFLKNCAQEVDDEDIRSVVENTLKGFSQTYPGVRQQS